MPTPRRKSTNPDRRSSRAPILTLIFALLILTGLSYLLARSMIILNRFFSGGH